MITKEPVIQILRDIRSDIRRNSNVNYYLILNMCRFINSLFCDCKIVEYWVMDMDFGQNTCNTELGHELKGLDTIEKFVDYLIAKQHV